MMKSIFTRPLFINPQAYSVIPELMLISKSLPYDFSSDLYVFQVITSGRIEGKLLKAGNEYILHLDLYTIDGNCVLGEFYIGNSSIGNIDGFVLEQSNGFVTIKFGDNGNISYPGLIAAWSAKGKSNDDEDRAILKDLTGNGHDISFNGFAFSEMSGYGGYVTNFENVPDRGDVISNNKSQKWIINSLSNREPITSSWSNFSGKGRTVKIKVTGLSSTGKILYVGVNLTASILTQLQDGINTVTFPNEEDVTEEGKYVVFRFSNIENVTGVTIEILPEYPDALVFDGVDDYGVNKNMPILTDYTIIAKRKDYTGACLFTKGEDIYNNAFIFEGETFNSNTYNFGRGQNVNLLKDLDISWQTKLFYNEQPLLSGGGPDKKGAFIGRISEVDKRFFKGAFYSAYLFDRSLDEQEIKSFIRKYIDPEYVLPSEQTTT